MSSTKESKKFFAPILGAIGTIVVAGILSSGKVVCNCSGWKWAFGITFVVALCLTGWLVYKYQEE